MSARNSTDVLQSKTGVTTLHPKNVKNNKIIKPRKFKAFTLSLHSVSVLPKAHLPMVDFALQKQLFRSKRYSKRMAVFLFKNTVV